MGGFGGGIYDDALGGVAFQQIGGGLPFTIVNALVTIPLQGPGPTLYAGADVGVYAGTFQGAGGWVWNRYGTGLPNVQVLDLQVQTYATTTYLAAATHGRGVWVIDPIETNRGNERPAALVNPPREEAALLLAALSHEASQAHLRRPGDAPSPAGRTDNDRIHGAVLSSHVPSRVTPSAFDGMKVLGGGSERAVNDQSAPALFDFFEPLEDAGHNLRQLPTAGRKG